MINSNKLEKICCNLCGSSNTDLVFEIQVRPDQLDRYGSNLFNMVRCKKCGLSYINPRPTSESLKTFYSFENPVDMQFVDDWSIDNSNQLRKLFQRYLRSLKHFYPTGLILDVGCGAGNFLVVAREAGYSIIGQEIAPFFIDYCRATQKIEVLAGELEQMPIPAGSLGCVTLFDVIEHHPYPLKLLQHINILLKPGGILMLSTHDIGNVFSRLYGKNWRYINPIAHLTMFTRKTMELMLNNAGFEVRKVSGIHTIDATPIAELKNWAINLFRVIFLRAIILYFYKPLVSIFPWLSNWQTQTSSGILNHKKLLFRTGSQIIMNDDMVIVAKKKE